MKYIIGIDPGVKTGVAVWQPRKKKLYLYTKNFHTTLEFIDKIKKSDIIKIYIEVPTRHVWHGEQSAFNVGGIVKESELLAGEIERRGITTIRHLPQGKLNAERFKILTNYQNRTNQHMRDAAMLVYGF